MADYTGTHMYGIVSSYAPSSEELTKALEQTNYVYKNVYTPGTGDYQCNSFYSDKTTDGNAKSYNLFALVDRYGTTLTLSKAKAIAIVNRSSTASQNIVVTGNFMTTVFGASFSYSIGPGGIFAVESPIDGMTVTNSSAHVITITPSATFDTQIFVAGLD